MSAPRENWKSKLGFVLAASGSAIGLGNIVFFSSNAYQYGGGAFYLPYFVALFVIGMPVMMVEFGLGSLTQQSFPMALRRLAGKRGEFVGWFSIASALFITMYYIAILGWGVGMMIGSFGSLFEPGVSAPFAPFSEPTEGASAMVYFFDLISTWNPMVYILILWMVNIYILRQGTHTIEKAVRIFVPVMWIFMIFLVIRGLTLPGGFDGVMFLFTPALEGISEPTVWKGAFSQMFFSLSLGLGTMTAYASYLPKDADQVNNSMLVSFLNCSFEFLAGVAIFSLLFVFALNPAGSTLSLSFFVIPQGINELSNSPWIVRLFGFGFYLLVVLAGITSSISLIESPAAALMDKFKIRRSKALMYIAIPCILGSFLFALPQIIDSGLTGNGTLGLTLLDITDHWVFNYSLLLVGLLEVIMMGWIFGAERLRQTLNVNAKLKLGRWFTFFIKYLIPGLLLTVIVLSLLEEWPLYGSTYDMPGYSWLSVFIPIFWIVTTTAFAYYLSNRKSKTA
jgi:NSS family neurotransmitter:Na+ symporter